MADRVEGGQIDQAWGNSCFKKARERQAEVPDRVGRACREDELAEGIEGKAVDLHP
jgi:hypothetical protein